MDDSRRPVGLRTRWALAAVTAVTAVVLVWHFTATFLSVAPVNPLTLRLNRLVDGYTRPFFVQNWKLFAPNPLTADRGILVRARLRTLRRPDRMTAFVDATTPQLDRLHANRFFASRRARVHLGALSALNIGDGPALQLPRKAPRGQETTGQDNLRRRAVTVLQAEASTVASAEWGSAVRQVQIRVVSHDLPPFSQRKAAHWGARAKYQDLPWMPYLTVNP